MAMSNTERASIAGRARSKSLSPQRRSEIARNAHLASAVSTVVKRAPELSDEQLSKLRAVFAS